MTVPKAELHVHLEGTATPALVRRLAARHGTEAPPGTIEGERFVWRDFLDFLDTYDRAASMIRTAEDYRDVTLAYLKGRGIEPSWGPITRQAYARAEIRDPNGFAIELRQWFSPGAA